MTQSAPTAPLHLVFGGSFNPPHRAHLAMVHAVRERVGADYSELIPSGQPWQKPHVVAAEHRLAMLQAAVLDDADAWSRSHPHAPYPLAINDIEVRRTGASYTVDTLRALKQLHPERVLMCLMGEDQIGRVHTWSRWQEMLTLAHLVWVPRGQAELTPKADEAAQAWQTYREQHATTVDAPHWRGQMSGAVIACPIARIDCSSTQIRAALARGESPDDLSASTLAYIQAHGLYRA